MKTNPKDLDCAMCGHSADTYAADAKGNKFALCSDCAEGFTEGEEEDE